MNELKEAAKQFYNLTMADATVIIRPPNAQKQAAIVAAGQSLVAALALPDAQPVAEIVNKFGDPEAFAERELKALTDIQKLQIGSKLFFASGSTAPQPACEATVDIEVWPQYIAGMIECYLEGKPLASGREAGIAAIIQRRMKFIPATPKPAPEPEPLSQCGSKELQALILAKLAQGDDHE